MTTVNVTRGDTTIVRIITAGPQGPAGGGGGGAGTDLSYDAATRTIASSTGTDAVLPVATTALAGLESAADKAKLDSITVDSATLVRKYVRNNSGVTIPKGAAVYQTGSSGTTLTVALADASTEATASQTLGLAQETIANNANGYIVAVGLLDGINTAALTEGQIIWLSETAGEVTTTRPTQPAHGVVCGYCVKQGAGTSGILYVKVDNGLELNELHDTLITGSIDGKVLRGGADGLWRNAALGVSDVTGALSAATAATTYQPLDSDLTSIAALTTTSFGRSLLTQADAAAARTTIGAGTGNGTVTGVTATAPLTSSGGTAPVISTSMATNRLLGRSTAGTGVAEEIQLGANLTLSGGVLSASVTGGGGGTVTSVGLSLPSIFTVSGSPVTSSGTLTGDLATQSANVILAGPTTGAAAAPTFRSLVAADLPATSVSPAAYGSASQVASFTVDAQGRLTAASNVTISIAATAISDSSATGRSVLTAADAAAGRSALSAAASGAIGSSGLTMATARLLGRTTAGTGAPEEITVGSGLSLSAGTLTANVGSTAGTVAAGDDSRITGALSAATAATTYQPLDSDLTSIAALTTTTFGRSLLTQADAAATRTTIGAGTVTGVTATGPLTSSGGSAPVISTSMATNRLLGRSTAGTGVAEEITVGSGLSLSAGTLTATGGGGSSFAGYAVNNWIQPVTGTIGAGNANNVNSIVLYPFKVDRSITVSDLGARVTTAAASAQFQLAIYASSSGLPTGTPLGNTASLSGATATTVSGAVTAFNLTAGQVYWAAFNCDIAITMQHLLGANSYFGSVIGTPNLSEISNSATITATTRSVAQTYGTWPDLTGVTTTVNSGTGTLRGALSYLKVSALL